LSLCPSSVFHFSILYFYSSSPVSVSSSCLHPYFSLHLHHLIFLRLFSNLSLTPVFSHYFPFL
jgi:hypothetical protein